MLEHLFISSAGTSGGGLDWVINDVEVDGVSQLAVKDLSGALFSTKGIAVRSRRATSRLSFYGLDVIERESEVAVTVTYVGSNPLGEPFFASIIGDTPPQRPTVLPIATKNALLPTVATTITAVLDRPLQIDMLEIEGAGTAGGAADWIVNDIRIDGTSQFKMSGAVPGDMFASNAIDSFVKFQPGTQIELLVTYIGFDEGGCRFAARVLGQFEVLLISPDWLPGMEAWYSGLLPYYLLLPAQIAILMVMSVGLLIVRQRTSWSNHRPTCARSSGRLGRPSTRKSSRAATGALTTCSQGPDN